MNNKTGKQIAAAIGDLAKAIDRLAATQKPTTHVVTGGPGGGGGGGGGVGGSPGGVSPRTGGGGGSGGGVATVTGALSIVGEAGDEYLGLQGTEVVYRPQSA